MEGVYERTINALKFIVEQLGMKKLGTVAQLGSIMWPELLDMVQQCIAPVIPSMHSQAEQFEAVLQRTSEFETLVATSVPPLRASRGGCYFASFCGQQATDSASPDAGGTTDWV